MIGQLTEAKDQQPTADDMSHQTTLLIGGCADGTLVIYEWEDKRNEGEIVFSLQVKWYFRKALDFFSQVASF